MTACETPLTWEKLVDYWAGDLPADEEERLEEHVMECAFCAGASARVAAITENLRAMIPPLLTRGAVQDLRLRGHRVKDAAFAPGERREAWFPRDADLLIFHLGGLDLSNAARVGVTLRDEITGALMLAEHEAPFENDAGEVLLCCQRHFAALPPDVVVEVRVHDRDGAERASTYTILHRME